MSKIEQENRENDYWYFKLPTDFNGEFKVALSSLPEHIKDYSQVQAYVEKVLLSKITDLTPIIK
jgi:hypothetical protein